MTKLKKKEEKNLKLLRALESILLIQVSKVFLLLPFPALASRKRGSMQGVCLQVTAISRLCAYVDHARPYRSLYDLRVI